VRWDVLSFGLAFNIFRTRNRREAVVGWLLGTLLLLEGQWRFERMNFLYGG
jgi:hypothetical protein